MGQFGVGQPVTRLEDPRLLTGRGCFTDDRHPAAAVYGWLLRAPVAHARIEALDCAAARAAPGVLAVYTAAELAADGVAEIACLSRPTPRPGSELRVHHQPLLAGDTARFAGEGLAFVVAESVNQARDAAERIALDYSPLPVCADTAGAPAADAARVWADAPNNTSFLWELGDRTGTDRAFAGAARVVTLSETNNRVLLAALETRAALGRYDPGTDKLTLDTGSQMPNATHGQLQQVLGLRPEQLRVRVADVGGGFGGKNSLFPEQALVLYAARRLRRPVKWVAERAEGLLTDYAGRDNVTTGELALDGDGRILGLRVRTVANLGAYTASRGNVSPLNVSMASNTYRIPAIHIEVRGVFTHTAPTDPYRGAGRPEILYLVERLLDVAAFDLGRDRVELRRRNLIPAEAFPYTTPTGLTYDHCDFAAVLDAALARSRWHDFAGRRAESAGRGRLRGIGLANYVERCGGGGGLAESAALALDPDGGVSLLIGTMANGQGHRTAYAQILADRLGLAPEKIRVVQGDTDRIPEGLGTGGSWSIPTGGGAAWQAGGALIEQGREVAGRLLEAAAVDIDYADGAFTVAGTDRRVTLTEIAAGAPGLTAHARFEPGNYTFPYGCHVCEVEVDPDTGLVTLLGYTAVHDFGRALNPLLLAGQVHGGVAQGIGQALLERTVYDRDGQLLSGSLMDYALPRAADLPAFAFEHRATPCPANPLGVKGCGEAGAAGSPPALVNAVVDALAPARHGVRHLDMPLTPETVWRALRSSG